MPGMDHYDEEKNLHLYSDLLTSMERKSEIWPLTVSGKHCSVKLAGTESRLPAGVWGGCWLQSCCAMCWPQRVNILILPWQLILWYQFPFVSPFLHRSCAERLSLCIHVLGIKCRLEIEIPAGSGAGWKPPEWAVPQKTSEKKVSFLDVEPGRTKVISEELLFFSFFRNKENFVILSKNIWFWFQYQD